MLFRGFLIALEGVDGCGKSTQARLLATALKNRGWEVVLTREPSDLPTGQQLRRYLDGVERHLTSGEELALFLEDRREHVRLVIQPALEAGRIVITDRYYYSNAAYQGALGLDPAQIIILNESFAPRPDLVFLFTLPLALALARLSGKQQLSEHPSYLAQVAAIFDSLTGPHIHRLEAAPPPEAIHARLLAITLKLLK